MKDRKQCNIRKRTLLKVSLFLYFTIDYYGVSAQVISSKILDKTTGKPVYGATILAASQYGVSADQKGYFTLELNRGFSKQDSLRISSIGYEELVLPITTKIDTLLYLTPKIEDLNAVFVSNKKLNIEEILTKVKNNLTTNYASGFTKKELFFRQSDNNHTDYFQVDFKKSSFEEIDKKFVEEELAKVPKRSVFHTEFLGDFYSDLDDHKLDIKKANKLYDIYGEDYLAGFYATLENILNKNVKKDSYFKIKSGLFSFKADADQSFIENEELIDMRNEMGKNDEANENFFLNLNRKAVGKIFKNLIYNDDSKLNFIFKPNRYDFEMLNFIEIGDNLAYQIKFDPNGGEDFKGVVYINTDDFAVLRVDYQNIKPLRSIKLLGFSYKEQGYKGTMIFQKGAHEKYGVKYIENVQTKVYGIDRPLKIIEKNKHTRGRRKQNELAADVNFGSTVVTDYKVLVYESDQISEEKFDSVIENKKEQPKNWKKYQPDFWKAYSKSINFDEEIRRLKSNLY
ncbi:carboxypeptidase-like regulatory domain-containing protein [Aquimarina agarivorans]|uniref:carboxypeptidase-like regulatory domain-containing protein n=1 Tax=Aquimarina agarivorans TaxID=980584 RepID=UPI000248E84C|nr:carboxypeptidase-like regulatory domain-containing protein [Aquimarina agarivorans]